MLHCDGKCYLRKQLAKLEEKTTDKNNIPISISNQKTIDDFVFEDNSKGFKNYFFTSKSNHSISKHPDFDIQKGYKNSVFRPPIFI